MVKLKKINMQYLVHLNVVMFLKNAKILEMHFKILLQILAKRVHMIKLHNWDSGEVLLLKHLALVMCWLLFK